MTSEQDPRESEIHMLPFVPFYFDPERMVFIVGSAESQILLYPKDMEDFWDIPRKAHKLPTDNNPATAETLVMLPFGPFIQMGSSRPILQEIFRNPKEAKDFKGRIRKTVRDVYRQAAPNIPLPRDAKRPDPWSFGMSLFEDGKFIVRTLGDCACLGPEEPAMYVNLPPGRYSSDDLSFPVQLGLHNADTRAQRLSLIAGAGTVGWITKQKAAEKG